MKTFSLQNTFFIFILLIFTALTSCNNYGKKLDYKGGELYYTDKVTVDEAKNLGTYLVEQKFFDEANAAQVSVQLNKENDTYQFRMVVKDGVEKDESYATTFKILAGEISDKVFKGAKLDFHLCDKELKTLKVIPYEAPSKTALSKSKRLEFNGGELYYTETIQEAQANALGKELIDDGFFDGKPKTVQINKEGDKYQFRMVINEEYLKNEEYINNAKVYARMLSVKMFDNAPVDVQFCDQYMNTLKELPFEKK